MPIMPKRRIDKKKEYAGDPYAHLAVAIILRAYDDLKEASPTPKSIYEGNTMSKESILDFFCSDWCATLLSFQNEISHEEFIEAVLPLFF